MIFLPRRRRRSIKWLQNLLKQEPEKLAKNAKYTKEDFIANKHGNEREPWVCLFLVRNTNPRKKNTTTGFVDG
jgi:hypothetical protein